MLLYNLGPVPWRDSQILYHALAHLGREALCLVSPSTPYVCLGYHQNPEQEVDLDFCQSRSIPVFRRDVGGGAVYLDGRQLFYQVILPRNHPSVPRGVERFYTKFLQPVIAVHHRLGIDARHKPVNDVIVGNRKISGTGVGEIGPSIAFVGNLILDFDYETMSRVLKVPDEKFRDKVKKTIYENLTTIRRELGAEADRYSEADLNAMMAAEFARLLGPMEPATIDDELRATARDIEKRMTADDWLYMRGRRVPGRVIKVRAGLNVVHRVHKAPGGLIRADFAVEDGRYRQVALSGDFFCFPKETVARLEERLEGLGVKDLAPALEEFYRTGGFEMPGVTEEDWRTVLTA